MPPLRSLLRPLRLRHLLFLLLVGFGTVPLALVGSTLVRQNRELLETQEKAFLTRSAASLSREVSGDLAATRRQLMQVGSALLALPGELPIEQRLKEAWVGPALESLLRANSAIVELQARDASGEGPRFAPADLAGANDADLDAVFRQALQTRRPAYRFSILPRANEPVVAISVPIARPAGASPQLVIEAVARLRVIEAMLEREAEDDFNTFLIDRDGRVLWAEAASEAMREAVAASDLVRDFARKPLNLTSEYPVEIGGRTVTMLARVSPVEETGWGVVVQKPAAAAFAAARQMVWTALLALGLLLVLALAFAAAISRLIGVPIQRLAETTHEIAAGNFGRRLPEGRMALELAELATDFNRMSGHVEDYVAKLEAAARENRELFISSIRAFAAAIDAKDPYTRGHSERVAQFSRAIARFLGQSEEFQQKIWIGALLHDVGKIGIEDRVLKKGGVLTPEEYQLMKAHPAVGAEILAPIAALRDMLPAIRWHHENWNGRGYPDSLRGEQIPLAARIVAVADCFDAITTNRPYQQAYSAPFAVETITKLAGTRFDAKVVTAFLRAFEAGEVSGRGDEAREESELPVAATV